jgi:tetratricopeptide (TPR) repeat protein
MISPQSHLMSDPLRSDGSRAHADVASGSDRDAKIEQLLLVGLDHYFAARYELAVNVWTRALFLDRSHARARAYIERARSALAERQRESEELLQNGVAAFRRGEGDEARRLLQAAIEGGAPSEEALAVLDRLSRLEPAALQAASPQSDRAFLDRAPHASRPTTTTIGGVRVVRGIIVLAVITVGLVGAAAWNDWAAWRSTGAFIGARAEPAPAIGSAPVSLDTALPLPRRGETALFRARVLAASGHLRDALITLDAVRPTDPQYSDANRLRADIQRELLALTPLPAGGAPDGGKVDPHNP